MANHALNLTGQRFGKLTAISVAHRNGGVHWNCQCDCGGTKVVYGPKLKQGGVKSCGCLVAESAAERVKDISGLRSGKLTAIKPTGRRRHGTEWECICDCGKTHIARSSKLTRGEVRSCGCTRGAALRTHGLSKTPEYGAWMSMVLRCTNPLNNRWHTHGARGISVCQRWLDSFEDFLSDMGCKPHPNLSLERKDNDGNYTPGNCTWATSRDQADNRRTTIRIKIDGRVQSLKAWCRELSLPYLRTWKRIYMYGWSLERALQP